MNLQSFRGPWGRSIIVGFLLGLTTGGLANGLRLPIIWPLLLNVIVAIGFGPRVMRR